MKRINLSKLPMRPLASLVVCAVAIVAVISPVLVNASSSSFNVLDNKSQAGMLMSLSANSGVIERADNKNAASLIGVISNDEVSLNQQPGQVTIKTDGAAIALVSTLGGDIRVGDRIAPSSLAGIGTKANGSGYIVGIAQASLDSKTSGSVASNITDSNGGKHKVFVNRIPIVVKVTYYTAPDSSNVLTKSIPPRLQAFADTIAGKHASLLAIVFSFILLLTGLIWVSIMVYAAIRGAFEAIARQPLTRALILRTLARSFGIAAVIMVSVFAGGLLILRIL